MTLSVESARESVRSLQQSESYRGLVTICGGGNGAHVAAGFLASKGIRVNVLTRQPERWNDTIEVITKGSSWEYKGTISGKLHLVSKSAKYVIPDADLIILAAPANAHPDILREISEYIKDGAVLGALFAQGGFDWAVKKILDSKMRQLDMIIGLQNIPWICKTQKYGHTARIIGPKKKLFVASFPAEKKIEASRLLESLFDIPCDHVSNFLTLTLTPSNQIIHPARYYAIFKDWDGMKTYTRAELENRSGMTLYADFDEYSAEQLAMLDNELQQIKLAILRKFPALDLSDVLPIGERVIKHYGVDVTDKSSLQKIFATNLGYAGCATPLVEVTQDRFIPAVHSRLFWEDIPFGLCILKCIAELSGNFPTPRLDFMIRWHQQYMKVEFLNADGQLNAQEMWRTGTPYKYGIHDLHDLVATSLPQEMREYRHPRSRI
uniref:Uncharacterized protein AlNc14C170G7975 n=1 Tax=Albugo laibachii Nc14 TaxID=890382 RepID=F0WNE8_9STRA|nr:conserved hypothetical protein [Albugo laibachii Nc14]|eukprot:CCA22839.1 conserved hypothetical protein [Albugo laibachii Nc14]